MNGGEGALAGFGAAAHVVAMLRRDIETGRPAHAYLLHGAPGTGQLDLAVRFAAALNCATAADDGCGVCASCRKSRIAAAQLFARLDAAPLDPAWIRVPHRDFGDGRDEHAVQSDHPDVFLLAPRFDGGGKTRNFRADDVKVVIERLAFAPLEAPRRIVLVPEAERMSEIGAVFANKLLKTLEEPPPDTVMVLTTDAPAGVLETIRSRCRKIALPLWTPDEIARLFARRGDDPDRGAALARAARGSPGRALELADAGTAAARREAVSTFMDVHGAGDDALDALVDAAGRLAAKGKGDERAVDALAARLDVIVSFLRDAAVLAATGDEQAAMHGDPPAELKTAAAMGTPALCALIDAVEAARRALTVNASAVDTALALLVRRRRLLTGT